MFRQNTFNPLYILVFLNLSLANSEDTDKIPHNAAFNRCPWLAKDRNGRQRKTNMLFGNCNLRPLGVYNNQPYFLMYYTRKKSH